MDSINLNMIDVALILLVLFGVMQGWLQGSLRAFGGLLAWIGGLVIALRFYQPVANWLSSFVAWSEVWTRPAAFLLLAALVHTLVSLGEQALEQRLPRDAHLRPLNRLLGGVLGIANGLIIAAIAAALLLALPLSPFVRTAVRESRLANRLGAYTEQVEFALSPIFGEAIARTFNLLTIQPDSRERVALPYTVAEAPARPDVEAEMLALVNQERAAVGLAPLAPDPELTEVARRHSADMFARGYFSHITPEGRDLSDRMRAAGVSFLVAGENLALAPTLQLAHTGLMNSPGHRANILRAEFGRVGIGIVDGGVRGLMITQNFRN